MRCCAPRAAPTCRTPEPPVRAARCRRRRTKHAARASDSRRRIRRRSPPGVTLFRRIACCRHSSAAHNWRFATHSPAHSSTPSPRGKRRSRTRIAAVPLATARQRHRGFNHAQEIARVVSSLTGVPLLAGLRRIRDSPPQAGLARVARARNVRGAFACAATLDGATVAIVDDVMTTGATLAAAAVALHDAGAGRVDAWIVARTSPPSHAPAKSP